MPGDRIDVLIADDHPVVVEGVRRHLTHLPDLHFVGSAASVDEIHECLRREHVDVVVLDVQMSGVSGREVTERLTGAGVRVVLFTLRAEDPLVANLVAGGACGFVSKSNPLANLVHAVREAQAGREVISPTLRSMCDEVGTPPHARLTQRESEVFGLLVRCVTPKEAAFELGVSTRTLYTHAERVRKKLGVATLAEIVQYAKTWGLTE